MKSLKGVVLEKSGLNYTVLLADGSFRRIHRLSGAEIGQEITVRPWLDMRNIKVLAGAAMLLLMLGTAFVWQLWQAPNAVAMLSLDINPSLELALDSGSHVVTTKPLNPDAKRLLLGLDLKGETAAQAVQQIITRAIALHFLTVNHSWVVVGVSPITGDTKQATSLPNAKVISAQITTAAQASGLSVQVAAFQVTAGEALAAQQMNLSAGEYALWQAANKAGITIPFQALKNTANRLKILDQQTVQHQIAGESDNALTAKQGQPPASNGNSSVARPSQNPEPAAPSTQSPSKQSNSAAARQGSGISKDLQQPANTTQPKQQSNNNNPTSGDTAHQNKKDLTGHTTHGNR
ncbi:MAG TPA: anti-sigma factor domain-containing protein [Desulfobacteria bacterium]|nr:anti-sigma factor domain-containing protein [Desulfobacteria bacterium]